MKKCDLHVHTKYSDRPSEWFLQKLGTSESYTEPEFLIKAASEAGMDYFTVTDHNEMRASEMIAKMFPDRAFTGTEATVYFPEDGCKVHVLVLGLDRRQFEEIEKLRENIYKFRDFIIKEKLAYSVAHATYSVNNKLSMSHIEKLLLLFDIFEARNGARDNNSNTIWENALFGLTPAHFEAMISKHGIQPASSNPWIKGTTGGSDDHAGLFIGKTYTTTHAASVSEFLENLRDRKTSAGGRHNDYHSFVFAIYKIAYEFSKTKSSPQSRNLLSELSSFIFDKQSMTFTDKLKVNKFRSSVKKTGNEVNAGILDMIETFTENGKMPAEEKLSLLYSKISGISDTFMKSFFRSVENDIKKADLSGIIKNISSSLPGVFLSLPFFTTLRHFNANRPLLNEISTVFRRDQPVEARKKLLWFTDTINDLNGVSVTLKNIGWQSHIGRHPVMIACCLDESELNRDLPPSLMKLPFIYNFSLPYYENYNLKIPSILESIKLIQEYAPDEIFISTPGPVGLLGLLAAKVLNVKANGIYHTDFSAQTNRIVNDASMESLIESGLRWFYSCMDEIKVPTSEYISLLSSRGYDNSKMTVFKRGIDHDLFSPKSGAREFMKETFGLPDDGPCFVYSGRISKDKNLDFLIEAYSIMHEKNPSINLVIAGDGPYSSELKEKCFNYKRVIFTGRQSQNIMPVIYSSADALLFPSVTDTFGMSVLEAQSCGIPAIVSKTGGPREIINEGVTGMSLDTKNPSEWADACLELIKGKEEEPYFYAAMKKASRENAVNNFNWDKVLVELTFCNKKSALKKEAAVLTAV